MGATFTKILSLHYYSLSLSLSIFTFVFANGMENVVKKSKDIYSYKTPQVGKLLCL